MMSEEFAAYLELGGFGQQKKTLFVGDMPSEPTECISLRTTIASVGGTRVLGKVGLDTELPRIQVLSRAATHKIAEEKLLAIRDYFAAILNQDIGGTVYLCVMPIQSPFYLKLDSNRWPVYAVNFEPERVL